MYKDHVVMFSGQLKELLGMEGDFVQVYVEQGGAYIHVVTSSRNEFKNSKLVSDYGYLEERTLNNVSA